MAGIEQAPQKAIVEIEKVAQDTAVNTHERTDLEQGYTDLSVTEGKSSQEDAFFVTFSLDDPEDPKNWTKKMEWGVTSALSASGFNCIIVSTVRFIESKEKLPILPPNQVVRNDFCYRNLVCR